MPDPLSAFFGLLAMISLVALYALFLLAGVGGIIARLARIEALLAARPEGPAPAPLPAPVPATIQQVFNITSGDGGPGWHDDDPRPADDCPCPDCPSRRDSPGGDDEL